MDYKEKCNLLKTKEIIEILDGDRKFGELKGRQISMPYLSGPDLCSLSTRFGLPEEYTWKG